MLSELPACKRFVTSFFRPPELHKNYRAFGGRTSFHSSQLFHPSDNRGKVFLALERASAN